MPFSEVFRLHGRYKADKPAVLHGDRTIDHGTLNRSVDGACWRLMDRGVRRGDIVGVALFDTPEHLITLLALSRLGAVILPVDWRWRDGEKGSVMRHFGARWLIAEPASQWHPGERIDATPDMFEPSEQPYRDFDITSDSPLLLSLSSGTTGSPKGPCVSHQRFENRFAVYWIDLGLTANDRFVSATPLYFGGGRGFSLATLLAGGTVCLYPPPYEPQDLIEHVNRINGSTLFLVPTLLRRLLAVEGVETGEGPAMPGLRALISSGAASHTEERLSVRQKLSANLYEMYSSTEGGAVSILCPSDFAQHTDSVGRPAFRVEVQIVDSQDQPLAAGEIGRLRYRSPASAQSFHGTEDREAFVDGWFYPGDLAAMNEAGYLFLRGRAKDRIIRGGINIYPVDIENVLRGDARIVDAAVIGVPAAEFGEEIVAFVVARSALDVSALRQLCKEHLAPYKVPTRILLVDSLPRSALGKVLKSELLKQLAPLDPATAVRPS